MAYLAAVLIAAQFGAAQGEGPFMKDTIETSAGPVAITFIGHGTLMLEWNGQVVHIDPWTNLADYGALPKATVILVTHEHFDHLDTKAIKAVRTDDTTVIVTQAAAKEVPGGVVMKNGDTKTVNGIGIEAVPAYNIAQKKPDGAPYHPKGAGNGHVLTFGDTRIYIAGDTENTPEMKALKDIAVAFLPMNLPYTMTPEMVADAAKAFHPRVLYPYHTGETDTAKLVDLMKDAGDIDVRIRPMK